MTDYDQQAFTELSQWQKKMQRKPSFLNKLSKKMQVKVNSYIPEKVHKVITATIKQMIKGVLFGAKFTTRKPVKVESLQATEEALQNMIKDYRHTAAAEGGITGAGGILLGLADFPILLGIKLKMLFDVAASYGFDVKDYKERVYILHIFELALAARNTAGIFMRRCMTGITKNNNCPMISTSLTGVIFSRNIVTILTWLKWRSLFRELVRWLVWW